MPEIPDSQASSSSQSQNAPPQTPYIGLPPRTSLIHDFLAAYSDEDLPESAYLETSQESAGDSPLLSSPEPSQSQSQDREGGEMVAIGDAVLDDTSQGSSFVLEDDVYDVVEDYSDDED